MPHSLNSLDFAEYFNDASANSGVADQFVPIIIDYMKQYQAGEIDYWTMPFPWNPNTGSVTMVPGPILTGTRNHIKHGFQIIRII